MKTKLTDDECHKLARKIAVGRSEREMLPILHVAHVVETAESEREKHAELLARRAAAVAKGATLHHATGQIQFDAATLDDLVAYLGDEQGSNHIDKMLALAWKAVLQRDQGEIEATLYMLFKAADRTFPHVRKAVEGEVAALQTRVKPEPK